MMRDGWFGNGEMMTGWGGMFFGPVIMIGILALIIFAIVVLVKSATGGEPQLHSKNRALSILEERFASGEIDEDEFERRRKKLLS